MKRILLTGANGFVGRQVLNTLNKLNIRVTPVVRSGRETLIGCSEVYDNIITSPDIFQETAYWWENKCKGVDTIIHSAWYTEPGKYQYSSLNLNCLNGSLALALGAINAGVTRFVGIGTCFEYELSSRFLSVNAPLNPLTPYAAAKAALFMALTPWMQTHSVQFVWCRLFNLYGIGEDKRRLIPYIHKQLSIGREVELGDGNQIRDYMNVCHAGEIIAKVALGQTRGALNICTGVPLSIREIAENIANKYRRGDLLRFGSRTTNSLEPPFVVGVPNHGIDIDHLGDPLTEMAAK